MKIDSCKTGYFHRRRASWLVSIIIVVELTTTHQSKAVLFHKLSRKWDVRQTVPCDGNILTNHKEKQYQSSQGKMWHHEQEQGHSQTPQIKGRCQLPGWLEHFFQLRLWSREKACSAQGDDISHSDVDDNRNRIASKEMRQSDKTSKREQVATEHTRSTSKKSFTESRRRQRIVPIHKPHRTVPLHFKSVAHGSPSFCPCLLVLVDAHVLHDFGIFLVVGSTRNQTGIAGSDIVKHARSKLIFCVFRGSRSIVESFQSWSVE